MLPAVLERVCLGQEAVVIIPSEALVPGDGGFVLAPAVREIVSGARGLPAARLEALLRALALRTARVSALATRAPRSWYPPRVVNLVVVRDGAAIRPFFQPLARSSWVVHECDFDDARSSIEVAAYALSHAERMGLVGDALGAFVADLSWWIALSDEEAKLFAAGARRSTRPDAAALRILADALPWLRSLFDLGLRPPPADAPSASRIPGTEIVFPAGLQPTVTRLLSDLDRATRDVASSFARRPATAAAGTRRRPLDVVTDWLRERRPPILLAGSKGETVWDPASPNHLGPLRNAMTRIDARCAVSLVADLAVMAERTSAFLARVLDPAGLPASSGAIDAGDGVWVVPARRLLAYGLVQPGLRPAEEPAPPLWRWLLAARAAHEWAHLAEDAGWVAVPEHRRAEHASALVEVEASFQRLIGSASPVLAAVAVREALQAGATGDRSPAATFAHMVFARIGDWRANLMAREVLEPEELWAYARQNARTHAQSGLGPFAQLARHAIEVHYLALAGAEDPAAVLFASTFFADHVVAAGLSDEARVRDLFAASGRALACWEIDRSRFAAPPV
jgi:hypothetical protein